MKFSWIALVIAALVVLPYRAPAQTAGASATQEPTAPPGYVLPAYNTIPPVRVLAFVRRVYRLHRPPPQFEIYTEDYHVWNSDGSIDYEQTHRKRYWVRNTDRASLVRLLGRDDYEGDLTFDRPALNQDRDPGPPTADLFEPAHPQPVSYVPTPEPSLAPNLRTIASVTSFGESDYNVTALTVEGNLLHLVLQPRRDPERNVLREVWVDKKTYVLKKLIAHDRMFIGGTSHVFPMSIVYTLGYLHGYVVITHLEGTVLPSTDPDASYESDTGDAPKVSIDFQDISFPQSLPDWYFNPREYAQHKDQAPE